MTVEPQIITTLLFNKRRGDELYSQKYCKLEVIVDPNRKVVRYLYTRWDLLTEKQEIRY